MRDYSKSYLRKFGALYAFCIFSFLSCFVLQMSIPGIQEFSVAWIFQSLDC